MVNIRFEDYSEKDTKLYKAIKTIIINPYFDIEFYEGKMCFNITEMSEVENISVYYSITEEGKEYYKELRLEYIKYVNTANRVLGLPLV